MLCCLIGGGLVAWLARSARRSGAGARRPGLGALFGFGAGMLTVELIVTLLGPLGAVGTTGSLPARIALLAVPALIAIFAARGGAVGSLLSPSAMAGVTMAAAGGALAIEEADLHLFGLHRAHGLPAGVAVHLPAFALLAAGLAWRAALVGRHVDGDCPSDRTAQPGVGLPVDRKAPS